MDRKGEETEDWRVNLLRYKKKTRFCHFHRGLDREEMSELSDISTKNVATTRSHTDNTMMVGVTEKPATSSSFSGRVKNTFGNFFPFTMGTGTGDEAETQEEEG